MTRPILRLAATTDARTPRRLVAGLVAFGLLAACAGASSGAAVVARRAASTASAGTRASTPTPASRPTPAAAALVAARPFAVHTPPGYDPATPAPLLVLLHGFGVTADLEEHYLRLTEATDTHGMLFVAPEGTRSPIGARFWNATDACCDASNTVDDVAYLTAVIADVKARYSVDPRRVFLVGHSNGGFMSYRMACDRAEEIAAIVSIAGATFAEPHRCRPSAPVAVLEVHGTADRTIAYGGGRINGRDAVYPGAARTVRSWARADGCRLDDPTRSHPRGRLVQHRPPPTVRSYTHCRDDTVAELWTLPGSPHIPSFTPTFRERVMSFLLAHPKPRSSALRDE